jgi:hypothetical protein
MKTFSQTVITFFISLLMFTNSFASSIEIPTNLVVTWKDTTSVSLSWDKVEWIDDYLIYYKNEDFSNNQSTNVNETEIINDLTFNITNLDQGGTYFFSIVSLDITWEESDYSDLIEVTLKEEYIDNNDFILNWIEIIENNSIELDFSADLYDGIDAVRNFKVVNKDDFLDKLEINEIELSQNDLSKIKVIFNDDIPEDNIYELTVVAIESEGGEVIESWIDSVETFVFNEQVKNKIIARKLAEQKAIEEAEALSLEAANDIEEVVLPAAPVEEKTVANDQLPTTWPEHVFLFLLSIILWFFIFIFKRKNS